MFSRFLSLAAAFATLGAAAEARDIRVCADPANLPFSNSKAEGFENRIVKLIGEQLDARIVYVWADERRSTALELLIRAKCDLVPGTIANAPGVATTAPYMHSSYAFVSRKGQGAISAFSDARLRGLRIGVQSIGDEAVTPPVDALLRRGLQSNILPFTLHGNASDPNSAAEIVGAVAAGDIDVAVLWGPFAGYYAAQQVAPVSVQLAAAEPGDPPMRYAIAMATRQDDQALRHEVDDVLRAKRGEIQNILAAFHVPLLAAGDMP